MAEEQQSLFQRSELPEASELLRLDEPEARKRFTAEHLLANIEKRDAICRALAEGVGIIRIARAFGVSEHTVMALKEKRPDLVAMEKKQLSGQIGRILRLSAERYEEGLLSGKIAPAQIPVGFGIFADKKAMLDGEASLVIEHRLSTGGSAEDFIKKLEEMKRARPAAAPATIDCASTVEPQETPEKEGH